ncbi:MAG: hypothetical protein LBQ66_07445 [Planctomycetaceae bacterium]|nr:hypothetical protein [Planctomycetaceae bacterium]
MRFTLPLLTSDNDLLATQPPSGRLPTLRSLTHEPLHFIGSKPPSLTLRECVYDLCWFRVGLNDVVCQIAIVCFYENCYSSFMIFWACNFWYLFALKYFICDDYF